MGNRNRAGSASAALVLGLLVSLPALTHDPRILHILIIVFLNSLLAITLRFIMLTGQISVAHAIFMAIGGYASALLTMKAGLSFWLGLPIGVAVGAAIAVLIGYVTLRIKGTYFILALFAFSEAIRRTFINFDFFGGPSGMINVPHPNTISLMGLSIPFTSKVPYYYLLLILGLLIFFVVQRLEKSRLGITFKAIAQADFLAESAGVNIMKYKVFAFAVGSMFASLIGVFYVHYSLLATPSSFDMWKAFDIIVFVSVGGMGNIAGPILGATFLTILPEFLSPLRQYESISYGIALVLVVLFMPGGLLQPIEWAGRKVGRLYRTYRRLIKPERGSAGV